MFDRKTEQGQWPLIPHDSIDRALAAISVDRRSVAALYPYSWSAPTDRAFECEIGADKIGLDGENWTICRRESGSNTGSLVWIRRAPLSSEKLKVLPELEEIESNGGPESTSPKLLLIGAEGAEPESGPTVRT